LKDQQFTFDHTPCQKWLVKTSPGSHRPFLTSSPWLFPITAQRCNLISQGLGALNIAAGKRHSQGKFQLLKLMVSLTGRWGKSSTRGLGATTQRSVLGARLR
jgi:hypothetical protein